MEKSLLMLGGLNKGLPIFASLLVASGILFSLVAIILPILVGEDLGLEELDAMGRMQGFRAEGLPAHASPGDSPYVAPLRITTPPLKETDSLVLRIFGEGRELGEIDCLGEMESWAGITELECNATIPYNYQNSENYKLYAVLTREEGEYAYPALGLLAGVPVAALFHAMHNSGEMIITLLGGGGALLYCCVLIPLFDYGGLLLLAVLFLRAVTRARQKNI